MLVADDDDFALEEAEAEQQFEAELAAELPADASSEPADEGVVLKEISMDDFVLLPHVEELVRAHREGGPSAGTEKMNELRRAVRRAELRMAALQHAAVEPVEATANLLAERDGNGDET